MCFCKGQEGDRANLLSIKNEYIIDRGRENIFWVFIVTTLIEILVFKRDLVTWYVYGSSHKDNDE